jgi:two-component system, cell cycle response regulator CpdR
MTAKPSRLPMKRILLAEDDESMRGFLERALTKAGYQVISFANGKEAHERLQEEPFTLLLTDIVMPQMDGIELARRAAELDPQRRTWIASSAATPSRHHRRQASSPAPI